MRWICGSDDRFIAAPVAATPTVWVDRGARGGRGRRRGIDVAGRAGTLVICTEGMYRDGGEEGGGEEATAKRGTGKPN